MRMAKAEEPTGPRAPAGRLLKATPSTLARGGALGLFTGAEAAQDTQVAQGKSGLWPSLALWGGGCGRQEMAGGLGKKDQLGNVSDGKGIQLDSACFPG